MCLEIVSIPTKRAQLKRVFYMKNTLNFLFDNIFIKNMKNKFVPIKIFLINLKVDGQKTRGTIYIDRHMGHGQKASFVN